MNRPTTVLLCAGAIVSSLATLFLAACATPGKDRHEQATRTEENILAAYGKAIYERESCANCHTQQIEKRNLQLISLDGLGGKYPDDWLYYYLLDPQTMNPGSRKRSFDKLYGNPLDQGVLSNIKKEKKLKPHIDRLWSGLTLQAKTLSDEWKDRGILAEQTEILALISYLQQIPASKQKLELDSLEHIQQLEEERIWDEILQDGGSPLLRIADANGSAKKGEVLFWNNCSACHGLQAQGMVGPNLTDDYWLHGGGKLDIARTIIYGVPAKGMISWKSQLSSGEVGALIAYICSLRGTNPENAKAPQGTRQ